MPDDERREFMAIGSNRQKLNHFISSFKGDSKDHANGEMFQLA
jgi:hypothetical protein